MTPFQAALAANRDRYNAEFRLARHRSPQLDPDDFLTHLRETVGPTVNAAVEADGDPTALTDGLISLSLTLAARAPIPVEMGRLLPELGRFVAAAPRRVPVAVVNALHHLTAAPEGDPAGWAETMIALAPAVPDVDALLDAGVVAAWRHGLAMLRGSALAVARKVPADTLRTVLRVQSDVDSMVLDRLADDPWLDPALPEGKRGLLVVRRVGRFRGFGGTFATPPRVFAANDHWYATDGEATWCVHADRFGTGLRRVHHVPVPDAASQDMTVTPDGRVSCNSHTLEVPQLTDATSSAVLGNTLAVTTPWTHAVTFIAWTVAS